MRIDLRIDRLVLDGLPATAAEAARIRRAAEMELGRLLAAAAPARLREGGALPSVPAPGLRLAGRETPEALGTRIAESVHRSLGGQVSDRRERP